MKFPARRLAVLALVAGIAFGAAPTLNRAGRCDAAEGGIAVTAIVRVPHPSPTGLSALAEGYNILIDWTNPAEPYSGTLIEWFTSRARAGTSDDSPWHQYEIYYPPASWTHVSAPMGAGYTVQASTYYDGGAVLSPPDTASVVLTSPVEVSSWCPTSGYAASAVLGKRYGSAAYASRFEAQLQVPGGVRNLSMASNPISWSPQLADAPTVRVFRLQTRKVRLPYSRFRLSRWWHLVSTGRGTFVDGYPAVCGYSFNSGTPAVYKLVMEAEFSEGFAHRGAQSWSETRYITLAATRYKSKITSRKVTGKPKHTKKITFSGALNPPGASVVRVTIQRLKGKKWAKYKVVSVRPGGKRAWTIRAMVKTRGSYRFKATVAASIVSPYREYASAISGWRRFKVR